MQGILAGDINMQLDRELVALESVRQAEYLIAVLALQRDQLYTQEDEDTE